MVLPRPELVGKILMKWPIFSLLLTVLFTATFEADGATLLASNAVWKYLVAPMPPSDWMQPAHDDTTWPSGPAELGYGDGDEATIIGYGPDPNNKYITTYFRTKFMAPDPSSYRSLSFDLVYDDGAVVYLNGVELHRVNMPDGPMSPATLALQVGDFEHDIRSFPPTTLPAGENILAVEVHQGFATSSDLSFALAVTVALPPAIAITNPPPDTVFTAPANFTLSADAFDPDGTVALVTFYHGDVLLGYRTAAPYNIGISNLAEGAHAFTARATDNDGLSSTSAPVVLTVSDPAPPTLVSAVATDTGVQVLFSKAVEQPSATALENYSLNPFASITAQYGAASNIVELATSELSDGLTYILTVNNVRDRAGNVIVANSQVAFVVNRFRSTDLGFPAVAGFTTQVTGGYNVTGAGTDIGGTSDQCQFNYKAVSWVGDFDLRVRVANVSSSEIWAKAALMARESLAANSRFAAAVATPLAAGSFFSYRALTAGPSTNAGSGPVTFPNMWLRLKRQGNALSGFMSADGNTWSPLGSVTLSGLAPELYVGMAVTSHKPAETAMAEFRDFSAVTSGTVGGLKLTREPLGPATRRSGLVISEIFYHRLCCARAMGDDDDDDDDDCKFGDEFIEIYNSNPYFEDLSGHRLTGNIQYRFPNGTRIPGGGFIVLRAWEYSGSLSGCNGVRLLDKSGAVLAQVDYSDHAPWPLASDSGHSIVLTRPSYGQNNPKSWTLSERLGGSPGIDEPFAVRASDTVRINEFHAGPELSLELYNHRSEAVDLSGYILRHDWMETVFPPGTLIAPRGFLVFPIASYATDVRLLTPDREHIVDAVRYQPSSTSSFGRYPDGADQFYTLSCASLGQPNCPPARSQVVINEIMYAPITGDTNDEYIELYNRGNTPVDLSGWFVGSAVQFTIPTGTKIGSDNYLVVAKNPQRMLQRYPYLVGKVVGPYSGELDDNGERIVLAEATASIVDELTYGVGGQWGEWSHGGGSSLELKDPRSDGRYAHNWADSDESNKGTWTTIEGTSIPGELQSFSNDQLLILLLGAGECLVDELEVRSNGGANLCANPGFESGLTGWFLQGSHDHSVLTQEPFAGNYALRLRAATAGDTGPSRVHSATFTPPTTGSVLLRAKVKWIRGSPEIALRLHGGGLDVSGRMQIQPNGTPGVRNSRAVPNAGPAIAEVSHDPPLPAPNEPVRVSAMVSDPDGPMTLTLKFRVEPSSTYVSIPMLDNGIAGDSVAGDGIYTATVPGQVTGTRAGFYIEARDALGAVNTFPQEVFPTPPYNRVFPTDALNRECIIRWGDTVLPGAFGSYYLWLNAANTARWSSRTPPLNDAPLDATFVYNNSRVIYNVRSAYHSSPWHRGNRTAGPDGVKAIDYSVNFPPDDQFLGATEALWIHPGNLQDGTSILISDESAQAESAANTILKAAGLQGNYQRYIHVFVNGSRRSMNRGLPFIMQDAQRPNVDMMDQRSPGDPGGDLLWLEDWMEYPDDGFNFTGNNDADLTRRELAAAGKPFHMGAYRFMFRPSDTRPGKSANDYSTLFALLNAVTPTNDAPIRLWAIDSILDYRQWMQMFAAQHTLGNWDTYGYDRGRNAYIYRSSTGRAQMWPWKNNFTLGVGGHGATMDVFGSTDPRILRMWEEPTILRAYWQGFYDLINGPFSNSFMDPIIDARVSALRDSGISVQAGLVASIKNYISARRSYLASRLQSAINVPLTAVAVSTNGNVLTLRGTAPIQVHHLFINGVPYPVTWLRTASNSFAPPTNWTAKVVLLPGVNHLTIAGYNANNELVTATITVDALYSGSEADPREHVMVTEIMHRPAQAGAEYVELFNRSPNLTFDLYGWQFDGLDFVFPGGSILGPNQFILLARNTYLLSAAFPVSSDVYTYPGQLDPDAETLSLLLPDGYSVVDRVRYESDPPWPEADGAALQVIDINEDNSRVSNWTDGFGWRYASYTGVIQGSATPNMQGTNFFIFLNSPGTVYIDDMMLVRGTIPEAGPNVLQNGTFEAPLQGTWAALGNHSTSSQSDGSHNGSKSLKVVSTGLGSVTANFVRQYIPGHTTNGVFTLSFWFLPTASGPMLTIRTAPGSAFRLERPTAPVTATPGQSNSSPVDLPPYDPIWLNEISTGGPEQWLELYNAGADPISLQNYFLAADYTAANEYSLQDHPPLGPGEFRVLSLPPMGATGSLALRRRVGTHNQIVDYFNYHVPIYGAVPDGQPFTRGPLRYATRAISNLSPRIHSIERYPGITYLRFDVTPGYRYYVEYKDQLTDSSWLSFGGNYLEASSPELQFADTQASAGQRFYRLTLVNAIK